MNKEIKKPAEQNQGEPVATVQMVDPLVLTTGGLHALKVGDKLYTHADPGEVDRILKGYVTRLAYDAVCREGDTLRAEVERLRKENARLKLNISEMNEDARVRDGQIAERDALLKGIVEYADLLLADCNRAWNRAGRCSDDDVHEDADYLRAVKLLSASAEPSAVNVGKQS